jgi:hypothetical protein
MLLRLFQLLMVLLTVSAVFGQEEGISLGGNANEAAWTEMPSVSPRRLPPVEMEGITASEDAPVLPPPTNEKPKANALPGMGMGMPGQRMSPFQYRAVWAPTTPVSGQNANFMMIDQSLSLAAPLGMPKKDDSMLGRPAGGWILSASVRNRTIETEALMPDTDTPYPDELWNVNMGLMYFRKMDNDWSWGGGVNFGSASDRPFASIDEMFVGMMGFLRVPSGERNAWMFSVFYAPMGELRFPIPGVAYSYSPADDFQMNIGLPFSIKYRPLERLTLEASYMLIHTIHAKASYKLMDCFSAFAAYDWSNESYALADRIEYNQRFFMYDQRLTAGLESTILEHCTLELAGGLIFDRYSFEGRQWDTTQFNRVTFGNGPFVSLQVGARF